MSARHGGIGGAVLLLGVLVVAGVACGDRDAGEGAGASSSPAGRPVAPSATSTAPSARGPVEAPPAEARPGDGVDGVEPVEEVVDPRGAIGARPRTITSATDDPALGGMLDLLARHYGAAAAAPFPLVVQEARLGGGRRALLFTAAGREGGARDGDAERPLVVVVDGEGHVLWHKERPLAGTHERARAMTITAGPGGAVLVFWWDVASRAVAGRRWGHDGSIFADFHFFDREDVTGLDAVRWPGHGWIVTAVGGGRAETALLLESGFRGFGDRVLDVSGRHEVLAPAVAAAGVDGVFVAYVGRARGAGGGEVEGGDARGVQPQIWVTFRRADGAPAWPAPVALGPAIAEKDGAWPHPTIELVTPARVRVTAGPVSGVIGSDGTR